MIRINLILLIFLFFFKDSFAQLPVSDTTEYLRSIVVNKSNYIGQPFSHLLDDLQIQIRFFSPFPGKPYDIKKETSTSFSFYYPENINDYYLSFPKIEIYWEPFLNAEISDIILSHGNNNGKWNQEAETFYSPAIIKDIKIRE